MCMHKFVDGFGSMGDAVVCAKCGYSKYPEALDLPSSIFCKTIRNDGTYGSRTTAPFVVKFATSITWGTDFEKYTHYFNAEGALVERK